MSDNNRSKSRILKIALFATGLSGIVAEYILSTFATYFLGDSVVQFTMIVSTMLFSMGLGSRISQYMTSGLLQKFIVIEFTLSMLTAFCGLITYTVAGFTEYVGPIIYLMSMMIGTMIGMEIPLVTRLNEEYESLRVNISAVMEKDYYGSLLGGVFFAFVGLPRLGLTYTPFLLGAVNFSVAFYLFVKFRGLLPEATKRWLFAGGFSVMAFLAVGAVFSKPIVQYGEQKKYKDKVIFEEQTKYQKLVITQWKDRYWFYIDGNQQLSTFDEWLYHEPMTHPLMKLSQNPAKILVLGGGDGCIVREALKYPAVENITLVDLDRRVTEIAQTHPVFTEMNDSSLTHPKVKVITGDAYNYMADTDEYYDLIFIDFPDPKSVELSKLYSLEFYANCYKKLRPEGIIITQAGSPYYATKAFMCIEKTMGEAGFATLPLHNQVLTLGEWGWVVGAKSIAKQDIRPRLLSLKFDDVKTRWLNHEAMPLIASFGKPLIEIDSAEIETNSIHNPVLYRYYLKGNWDLY